MYTYIIIIINIIIKPLIYYLQKILEYLKVTIYENYLPTLHQKDATTLCKFRCRSHALPVTKGRFDTNIPYIEM